MTTTAGRPQQLSVHEARQRLEHERNSRLAQLTAIEGSASHTAAELMAVQTAAIRRVLADIDEARHRLTDGSFGTCKGCRNTIPVERLEILPYVRYCVACQQRTT